MPESDHSQPLPELPHQPISDLQRYRSLVGHLICESLGYFTVHAASRALQAHRNGEPFACEWYSHIAMTQGKGLFDQETLIRVNRETIKRAFEGRRRHEGYMAEYQQAKSLVDREIENEGSTGGMLASWF